MYNNSNIDYRQYDQAKESMNVTYNQDKYVKRKRQEQEEMQKHALIAFLVVLLIGIVYSVWPTQLTNEEQAVVTCQNACSNTVRFDCEKTCKPFENMSKKHRKCVDGCHQFYDSGCYRGCSSETTVEKCIESSEECHADYKGLCNIFKIVTKSACSASKERYKSDLHSILHH